MKLQWKSTSTFTEKITSSAVSTETGLILFASLRPGSVASLAARERRTITADSTDKLSPEIRDVNVRAEANVVGEIPTVVVGIVVDDDVVGVP